MRVLVLTQYFQPETFRINEVVQSLRQLGCDVTVLTGQPNYPDGKVFPGYSAWGYGRDPKVSEGPVYRVPMAPRGAGKAWRLAINYLSFVVSASLVGAWLLRGQKFDVIFVYGISPITQALPGILLKRPKGAVLVTWVQDLWPQAVAVTGLVQKRWLLQSVAAMVRWIYRHNDLLLAQSHAFVPAIEAMAGGTPVRYHPNPGELSFSQPALADAAPGVEFEAGFNIVFAGNLGTVQALDTVLDAAELLVGEPDIHFVLVGSGSRGNWLMQEVQRRKLVNVRFAGRLPPQAMPAVLAMAAALLVTLIRSDIMSQTIPSKVQAYLAAGRPIIACLDGEGARVVEEAGAGLACPAESASALAQTILKLKSLSPERLAQMGVSGRAYYEKHFEPASLARELLERFKEVASK